jgi:hypothetical protein
MASESPPAFFLPLAIAIRHSTFGNSCGGIAQLVERQLCKLDVRGSNPLASNSHFGLRIPERMTRSGGEGVNRRFGLQRPGSGRALLPPAAKHSAIIDRRYSKSICTVCAAHPARYPLAAAFNFPVSEIRF